jgi:alkylation response protein AidB-like acyl-CoA dehydrogenase
MVPVSDWSVEDTWFVAGMRGTGSNTIVADDVFIPDHRTLSLGAAVGGNYLTPFTDEVLYRSSFVPFLAIVLAGPITGLAKAALDLVIEKSSKRGLTYTQFTKQADSTAFQMAVAKAAMLCDTARLHMLRAAGDIDAAAARNEFLPFIDRARVRADAGYSTTCAREAIDILLTAHGTGSFAEINPLQRIWRDASTAGRHAVLSPLLSDEIYGKALVGLPAEENITPLI